MKWRDMTTYRHGDRERKPRILECKLNDSIILKVHKHIYYEDEWLLSCSFLGFDCRQLGTTNMEQAEINALATACKELRNMESIIKEAIFAIRESVYRGKF